MRRIQILLASAGAILQQAYKHTPETVPFQIFEENQPGESMIPKRRLYFCASDSGRE
jgi:hypothetical protein